VKNPRKRKETCKHVDIFCLGCIELMSFTSATREAGEELSSLPFVRPRKKPNESIKEAKMKKKGVNIDDSSKLLAASRLMAAFNDGDIELVLEITDDVATANCIIDIKALNRRLFGIESLKSLWKSLFEAFPDGNFRYSDTSVDHHLNLLTSFQFSGVKIFPIRIVGGALIESTCNSQSKGSSSRVTPSLSFDDATPQSIQKMFGGIQNIVDAFYCIEKTPTNLERLTHAESISVAGSEGIMSTSSSACEAVIDTSAPLHSSTELLKTERSSVYRTNGKMILQINKEGFVERFVFDWDNICR
jgi:hypothetical protein